MTSDARTGDLKVMAGANDQSTELIRRGALFNDAGAVHSGPVTSHTGSDGVGTAWGATDVGLVRVQNQDCFAIGLDGRLIIVADGMGGHSAGEVASTWAVETMTDLILDRVAEGVALNGEVLREAVDRAQERLCRAAMLESTFRGMGTTLVAGIECDDVLYLSHVGDVRAYLYRGGILSQLTRDHSTVQKLIDRGELEPHEAQDHPRRNEVLQAIGQIPNFDPSAAEIALQERDRVLLCCDGLWDAMPESAIVDALRDNAAPDGCATELIAGAKAGGGRDNVTAVIYDHS